MAAIPILMASLMPTCGFCEGVFALRKITITIDDGTLECLRAMREAFGIPYSGAIRRAVWSYYQDKFSIPPAKEN